MRQNFRRKVVYASLCLPENCLMILQSTLPNKTISSQVVQPESQVSGGEGTSQGWRNLLEVREARFTCTLCSLQPSLALVVSSPQYFLTFFDFTAEFLHEFNFSRRGEEGTSESYSWLIPCTKGFTPKLLKRASLQPQCVSPSLPSHAPFVTSPSTTSNKCWVVIFFLSSM